MNTKFDDNVAQDIPVTKDSSEPGLPWKISEAEIDRIEAAGQDNRSAMTAPPLQVRAVFVVLLVVAIFVVIMNSMVNVVMDNKQIQLNISSKDRLVASIQTELDKAANQTKVMSDNTEKLEKRINDLSAQKELYTAVIETLTKKTDDTQTN